MPHSEEAYEVARVIVDCLVEADTLKFGDDFTRRRARGIIQTILEDSYKLIPIRRITNAKKNTAPTYA